MSKYVQIGAVILKAWALQWAHLTLQEKTALLIL